MSYQVIIPKTVQKEIDKLPKNVQESIIEGLLTLKENSRPPNSLKMKNSQGYRLRMGDYTRISHKIIFRSHNPYLVKVKQNHGFNSVLFFLPHCDQDSSEFCNKIYSLLQDVGRAGRT